MNRNVNQPPFCSTIHSFSTHSANAHLLFRLPCERYLEEGRRLRALRETGRKRKYDTRDRLRDESIIIHLGGDRIPANPHGCERFTADPFRRLASSCVETLLPAREGPYGSDPAT